jgi:cysteine desulfurase family protein
MIYLDNAAGSHPKPPQVGAAMARALDVYGANPGRGNHEMTRQTAAMVEAVRYQVAEFFGLKDSTRVIFTAGATMSLNMAIYGLLREGDTLILPGMEHNSISRPACALEDAGKIKIKSLMADQAGYLKTDEISQACASQPHPALLALTHASNVCGSLAPLDEIAAIARKRGVPLLVDAAQSAGLVEISMSKTPLSVLALAGHKALYGPPGIGVLLVSDWVSPAPLVRGGTGNLSEERGQPEFYPDRLEAGSLNVPGIAGLGAALDFVAEIGIEELYAKAMQLTGRLAEMAGNIAGIELYLPPRPQPPLPPQHRVPVLALNISRRDPAEVSSLLDSRYGIAIRSGYHCAPAAHRALGTMAEGCLRFSPGWFNTMAEIEKAGQALAELAC